jgi:hypothetical protein
MSNTDNVVAEIRTLENEFKAGRISAGELKELLEDVKYSKAIVAAADDLALKAQLFELIDGILTAAKAI